MGKAQSRPTAGIASRRTRVLAALALFFVLAMPLAGTWPDQSASAQVIWDFWMESDMDLYGSDQAIRLFGNIGYAIADHPIVIQVFDERNNLVDLDQVQTDSSGGFEATVGPIRDDGSYTVHAKHEFAGSTWTTFTIAQPPEAVLEEEPEQVPETEDMPPETEDAVPPVRETSPRAPMTGVVTVLHCMFEGPKFIISGLVLDGDVDPVCIMLSTALITLLIILIPWSVYRRRRRKRQAKYEETMPSGRDVAREPQQETGAEPPSVTTRGTGAFPPQEAVRESVKSQEQPPDHRAVVRSSQKAAGGGFPQKKPQSGHRTDSSSLSKPVETAPTQKRKPAAKAATSTVPKAQDRASVRQAGKTGFAAKLEGKLVAFDTNICIRYMRAKFLDDGEMSDKARDFFGETQRAKMDPDIPDCIDTVLKNGAVLLPWRTITEFDGVIGDFIRDEKMDEADKPKLEKVRLFKIIFESREISAHSDITIGFEPDDLVEVEKMFDGFAKSTHPGMKKKMDKVYQKRLDKANEDKDEAKIAEVERAKADKKFPLEEGDKEILATVLTNSTEPRPICLITMDGDFTRFVGEIRKSIGIEIVSGFQPRRRRAEKRSSR